MERTFIKVQRKIEGTIALYNGPWQTQPYRAWTRILALEGWGLRFGARQNEDFGRRIRSSVVGAGALLWRGKVGHIQPIMPKSLPPPADVNKTQLVF
jgi:hypothetical protein